MIKKSRFRADPILMRQLNKNRVLQFIKSNEIVSHREICNYTSLSKATITDIIRNLSEESFVEVVGLGNSSSNGGRKPTLLRFNPRAGYVIGVDIDISETTVAVLNLSSGIEDKVNVPTQGERGHKVVFAELIQTMNHIIDKLQIDKKKVMGVGIGFPGAVDHNKGVCVLTAGLGWRDVPIKNIVEKGCGFRTFVDSNMRVKALGEHWFGMGKNVNNMVYVNVRDGIGVGIIIDGKIYRGEHNRAGEIGHNPVVVNNGVRCICGKFGCLNAYVAGNAIIARLREAIREGVRTSIVDIDESKSHSSIVEHLFESARNGDEFALKVVNEVGYYLGIGIAKEINGFDPEIVILSGYVIEKSDGMLLEIIRKTAQEKMFDSDSHLVRIEKSSLGENASIIGAAALVCQDLFNFPLIHA